MKKCWVTVCSTLAVMLVSAGCERERPTFSCTRRSGDWGLFKSRSEGPELVACFGGMAESKDDERLCKAALGAGSLGPGDFFCSVFP
jgi:hypothetical protein